MARIGECSAVCLVAIISSACASDASGENGPPLASSQSQSLLNCDAGAPPADIFVRGVDDNWQGTSSRGWPTIAAIQTFNGSDPAGVRLRKAPPYPPVVDVKVEEEQSSGSETQHVEEDVAMLGMPEGDLFDPTSSVRTSGLVGFRRKPRSTRISRSSSTTRMHRSTSSRPINAKTFSTTTGSNAAFRQPDL